MKKFLLLAAGAAMMVSANAQTLTKVSDAALSPAPAKNEARQGFGLGDKFYIQNKQTKQIEIYGLDGKFTKNFHESGPACAISHDEAGNIVVGTFAFPNSIRIDTTTIKVISPDGSNAVDFTLPAGMISGRMDFFGVAQGDLLTDGTLCLAGAKNTQLAILKFTDGAIDADASFLAPVEGAGYTSSTVINPWLDVNGKQRYLFVTRNANPMDVLVDEAAGGTTATAFALPNKGASNGAMAFTLEGKNYIVYPTLPNYLDGFAIAELTEGEAGLVAGDAPVATFEPTVTANPNGIQANWLNVEPVSSNIANIYQYVPELGVRKFTFEVPTATGVNNVNSEKVVAGVKYVNTLGMQSAEPFEGLNIVVTSYTDGSQKTEKVMK